MEAMCQTLRERKSKSLDKGIWWGEKEKWRKRNIEKNNERKGKKGKINKSFGWFWYCLRQERRRGKDE